MRTNEFKIEHSSEAQYKDAVTASLEDKGANNKVYYYGLDWLRAIFCIAIVFWHTTGFLFIEDPLLQYIIASYFGLLGVPVFFTVSLFLHNSKLIKLDKKRAALLKRIKDLLIIYGFWLPINWVLNENGDIAHIFESPIIFAYFLLGNYSQLYYLSILVIMSLISVPFISLQKVLVQRNKGQLGYPLTIICFLVISILLMIIGFGISKTVGFGLGYANPLNFLPYIFSSILVVLIRQKFFSNEITSTKSPNGRASSSSSIPPPPSKSSLGRIDGTPINRIPLYIPKQKEILLTFFAGLGVTLSFVEKIAWDQNWLNCRDFVYFEYGRTSLILFSMVLLIGCLSIKRKPPRIITFFSDLSLGIYVLHVIVLTFTANIAESFHISMHPVVLFISTLIITTVVVMILRNFTRKIL